MGLILIYYLHWSKSYVWSACCANADKVRLIHSHMMHSYMHGLEHFINPKAFIKKMGKRRNHVYKKILGVLLLEVFIQDLLSASIVTMQFLYSKGWWLNHLLYWVLKWGNHATTVFKWLMMYYAHLAMSQKIHGKLMRWGSSTSNPSRWMRKWNLIWV